MNQDILVVLLTAYGNWGVKYYKMYVIASEQQNNIKTRLPKQDYLESLVHIDFDQTLTTTDIAAKVHYFR